MLNTNEIEKVAEKQILKSETNLKNPTLNPEENLPEAEMLSTEILVQEETILEGTMLEGNILEANIFEANIFEANILEATMLEGNLLEGTLQEKLLEVVDTGADAYSDFDVDSIDNILELKADQFPRFTLAKNKARFLRMVSDYRSKQEWLDVAPLSGVTKLFKQQTKELVGIRAKKLDYEMEIEMGTLTPVQISHRRDELKMCKVQEKMAVSLISKMQVKIRSGRR